MRMHKYHLALVLTGSALACQGQPAAPKTDAKADVKADVKPDVKADVKPDVKAADPPIEDKDVAAKDTSTVVGAGLTKEQIRPVVREHINEIRGCYNQGLAKNPELKGEIVVGFTIDAEGKVKDAKADKTAFDETMSGCVVKAMGGWTYPKPSDGKEVKVSYPFVLEPG